MELADSSTFFSLREGGRGLGLKQTMGPLIAGRELLTGQIVPTEPIVFRYALGSVPGDLIMCSDTNVLLISGLFRSVLEDNQFTGWSTYPVLDLNPQTESVRGPLETVLRRLTPMSLAHRELLLRTDSSWTAYFAGYRTGADEASVSYLARLSISIPKESLIHNQAVHGKDKSHQATPEGAPNRKPTLPKHLTSHGPQSD